MEDPEIRSLDGLHWHAYVKSGETCADRAGTRQLPAPPVRVFVRPDDVVGWISEMTRRHAYRTPVRLLGGSGWAAVGDAGHLYHDEGVNLAVLNRGHNLRVDFPRAHDRMQLCVEAVSSLECPEVHDVPR